jgi:hypothetical protein
MLILALLLFIFIAVMTTHSEDAKEDAIAARAACANEGREMVFCNTCKYYDNGVYYLTVPGLIECTCPAHKTVTARPTGASVYNGDCVDFNANNDCPNYVKKPTRRPRWRI